MYNPFVGILKFILSLLVVAIHVQPFEGAVGFYLNNCIARLAVPIFFILSSYYLFDKLQKNNWDKTIFAKHQIHLTKYYFVWVLLNLPFILNLLLNSTNSLSEFIWKLIQGILLKGPYGALWFLPASLLGLALCFYLGKRTNYKVCCVLSLPLFLFATIQIEYNAFVKDIAWINTVNGFFTSIFGWLANGLNVGFFFCAIGFYIAANKQKTRKISQDILKAILSIGLLLVETTLIRKYQLGVDYWAMFFIIPSAYYISQVVLNMKPTKNEKTILIAKQLQTLSLLIYPMHFAIMDMLKILFADINIYQKSTTLQFFVVITITLGLSAILLYLGEKKNIRCIKTLYGK